MLAPEGLSGAIWPAAFALAAAKALRRAGNFVSIGRPTWIWKDSHKLTLCGDHRKSILGFSFFLHDNLFSFQCFFSACLPWNFG